MRNIKNFINKSGQETAYAMIRIFRKSDAPYTPRWHTDGSPAVLKADKNFPSLAYKIVFTFKGPSTIFYHFKDKNRKKFDEISLFNPIDPRTKKRLSIADIKDQLQKIQKDTSHYLNDIPEKMDALTQTTDNNVAALFSLGDACPVHSEPPITQDRLFFGIFLGPKDHLEAIYPKPIT